MKNEKDYESTTTMASNVTGRLKIILLVLKWIFNQLLQGNNMYYHVSWISRKVIILLGDTTLIFKTAQTRIIQTYSNERYKFIEKVRQGHSKQ